MKQPQSRQPGQPGPGPFERVLVATDFSPCAAAALDWAIEIARPHRARIDLVHAIEVASVESAPGELEAKVARKLAELEQVVRRAGITAGSRYQVGRAWDVVTEAEREFRPDLVVVGARGHTAYARLFLGSRADRILRMASAPVLTVHPGDAGRQSSIRTVLVASDFSEEAALATSCAVRLARALPGRPRLVLLHVWQPPIEYEGFPAVDVAYVGRLDQSRRDAERLLEGAAAPLRDGTMDVQAVVQQGYPAMVIEREAQAVGASLIAVGTHGRSGLRRMLMGSIAERVVHHAPCPVVTVRRPQPAEPMQLSEEAQA